MSISKLLLKNMFFSAESTIWCINTGTSDLLYTKQIARELPLLYLYIYTHTHTHTQYYTVSNYFGILYGRQAQATQLCSSLLSFYTSFIPSLVHFIHIYSGWLSEPGLSSGLGFHFNNLFISSGKGARCCPCSGYVWVNGWFVSVFSTFTYPIQIFLSFCLKEQWSQ